MVGAALIDQEIVAQCLFGAHVPVGADHVARDGQLALAAEHRFRPIMMTAITTIGGLVRLALAGRGQSGISYTSFALTLIGGMATATLLTLLVVPVFYTFFDDLREAVTHAIRSVLTRRPVWGPQP